MCMARGQYPAPVGFAAILVLAAILLWLFPWTTPTIVFLVAWATILFWTNISERIVESESAEDEFEDPYILGICISSEKLVLICLVLGMLALFSPNWIVPDDSYTYSDESTGLRDYYYDSEKEGSHYSQLNNCIEASESDSPLDGQCNSQISYFAGGMVTSIILAIGSIYALLALLGDKSRSEKNTERAGSVMLVGPMIWYLINRFGEGAWDFSGYNGNSSWYYVWQEPGMGFWMAIIGGVAGLSAINGSVCNRIFVYVTQTTRKLSGREDLFYAKIALVAIPLSLLMPYLSIVGLDITGSSMVESSVEMIDTGVFVIVDDDATLDSGYGGLFGLFGEISDSNIDTKEKTFVLIIFLLICFAPLFFIWSVIEVIIGLYYRSRINRKIAVWHLGCFFSIVAIFWLIPDWVLYEMGSNFDLGIYGVEIGSFTGFLGFGFWIGGLSGFGLLHTPEAPSQP